jgi:membrane protein DedA with SNARE-associated domain
VSETLPAGSTSDPTSSHPSGAASGPTGGSGVGVPSPLLRRAAVGVAVLRYVVPLVVIPGIPFLIATDRLALLVLLRPQKEFLILAAAQLARTGTPSIPLLLAAYVPLMVVAIWAFFIVGRIFRPALDAGDAPRWLTRILPPEQLDVARRVLARRGPAIAVMGRLAALPPTIMAAAAGASDVDGRRYLAADLVGAFGSFALMVGAGLLLGDAYDEYGWSVTVAGVVVLISLIWLITRWVRKEAAQDV